MTTTETADDTLRQITETARFATSGDKPQPDFPVQVPAGLWLELMRERGEKPVSLKGYSDADLAGEMLRRAMYREKYPTGMKAIT